MYGGDAMNKAFKFRLYPTEEQKAKIEKTFNCVRFIFNKMLEDKLAYYNETGKFLKNTPAQYKTEFPWLKEVDSLALANAQLNLQDAYTRFFRNPAGGFPKFKSRKHSKKTYTTNCVNNNIIIRDGTIKFPKIGFVRIKLHRVIPNNYKLKAVTVIHDARGYYYASVLFEYEPEKAEIIPESCIGVEYSDSGFYNGLYVDSDGEQVNYPPYIQQTIEKLRREKKRLLNMKYKSNNRAKQRIKVNRLREKFYRQRCDFLHKKSRQIANAYDCVCIKDPAQGVSYDFGWALFKFFLKYKLLEKGKSLVMTDNIALSKMLYSVQAV